MTPDGDRDPDPRGGLVDVLYLVASRLRHPLFLVGLGAAILLTLIALWGPDGGQLYAALLAGLIFLLAVIWALTSGRPAPRTGHRVRTGVFSRAGNITQESGGDASSHEVSSGAFSAVRDIAQRGGRRRPPEER